MYVVRVVIVRNEKKDDASSSSFVVFFWRQRINITGHSIVFLFDGRLRKMEEERKKIEKGTF
jgi:hypothetical protein